MSTATRRSAAAPASRGHFRITDYLLCARVFLFFVALIAAAASAKPAPTAPGDPLDPRTYEPKSRCSSRLHATGVQKYTCQANGTWLFTDPEATLVQAERRAEGEGDAFPELRERRPAWRFKDGSSVEAAKKVTSPAGAANIAWLLLEAVVTIDGDDGDRLSDTTWVQRLNTAGGVAPAGTCTPGARTAVPYTADYLFWRSKGKEDAED